MKKQSALLNRSIEIKNKIDSGIDLKVEPFRKETRRTNPHKHHSYFELVYLRHGSGFHQIDNQKFIVEPPQIFFVRKDQVHHWDLSGEPEGYVVIVKNAFMQKSMDNALKQLFSKLSNFSYMPVQDAPILESLFELLCAENKRSHDLSFLLKEGLLKALLAKILTYSNPVQHKSSGSSDVFNAFYELLASGENRQNKVADYAKRLHTTPQNLNAICRREVNQSAGDLLREFIIVEAKRLLIYTSKTSAEIAFDLGFSDPSHFVKYFKKVVGSTPQQFRNTV